MTTRLVLLTHDYPFNGGDASFVRHEIDAIAARFDEVIVFSYARTERPIRTDLPANVSHGGNLYGSDYTQSLLAVLSPTALGTLGRVVRAERRAGRIKGNARRLILAALLGMRIARHPGLRRALTEPGTRVTVYSFWGMGAALSLPWLPAVAGGAFLRLHRYDLYEEESGYLPFRRSLFASSSRILAISEDARRYLLERYPDAGLDARITVNRLGTADVAPASRPARQETRTLVSCSGITPVKQVGRILDGLALLAPAEPVRWIHFGDGPLRDELRLRVEQARIDGVHVELRGAVDNEDLLAFYATNRVDVFLNVSASEGVPVSIMEAMSFGIPVIATRVGGTPEIVGPELGSGELVGEAAEATELADAIKAMLDKPDSAYDARAAWERLCDARVTSAALADLMAG